MLALGFMKGSFFGFLLGLLFNRFCKTINQKNDEQNIQEKNK